MPPPKKPQSHNRFGQEIVAVLFLFFAVFLFLCLLSYSLPLVAQQPTLQEPSANWCGSFGFYIAHYLFSFFGLTAFFPVLVLLYSGVTTLLPGSLTSRLPFVVAGITGLLISSSGLLATTEQQIFPPQFITPGGYLGGLVWNLVGSLLGNVGQSCCCFCF